MEETRGETLGGLDDVTGGEFDGPNGVLSAVWDWSQEAPPLRITNSLVWVACDRSNEMTGDFVGTDVLPCIICTGSDKRTGEFEQPNSLLPVI